MLETAQRSPEKTPAPITRSSCNCLFQALGQPVTRQPATLATPREWTTLSAMFDPGQSPPGFYWSGQTAWFPCVVASSASADSQRPLLVGLLDTGVLSVPWQP